MEAVANVDGAGNHAFHLVGIPHAWSRIRLNASRSRLLHLCSPGSRRGRRMDRRSKADAFAAGRTCELTFPR